MRRVLSLWQPWASLTCTIDPLRGCYAKEFETRHWTPLRGHKANSYIRTERVALQLPIPVVIHATLRDETRRLDHDDDLLQLVERCGLKESRPTGSIIAVASIVSVHSTDDCRPSRWESVAGDWGPGRYVWQLSDVTPLDTTIPLKGRQEPLWVLPDEIEQEVYAAFPPGAPSPVQSAPPAMHPSVPETRASQGPVRSDEDGGK